MDRHIDTPEPPALAPMGYWPEYLRLMDRCEKAEEQRDLYRQALQEISDMRTRLFRGGSIPERYASFDDWAADLAIAALKS